MRPDDARGRPRTSDPDGPSTFRLPPAPQMAYFLADESSISSSCQSPAVVQHRAKEHRMAPPAEPPGHLFRPPRAPSRHGGEGERETPARPSSSKGPLDALRHEYGSSRSVSPFPGSADTPSHSQPLTPVLFGASGPASALSSASSRRNSLCLSEDLGSRPPSMKGGEVAVEDDDEPADDGQAAGEAGASGSSMVDSGSAPQLIMPSIKMPSRRPFTDEGKRMGRLKVLVAGDSGVGKTSLVKAVVQSCEHIVHVDPIAPSALTASSLTRSIPTSVGLPGRKSKGGRRPSATESLGTSQIAEIYASTKPYPEWWSEVDDLRVLRRRKSLGDAVLDRNICFVDTPGYGNGSSAMDTITPVVQYIEAHLQRINTNFLHDGDLLNLLGGEGGVQVDAVFYMVLNRLRPVDIEYLRHLAPLTNVIILLAQSDLMSAEQVAASKDQIYSQLKEANVRPFSFSMPSSNHSVSSDPEKQGVYAISSATGSDHDTMDASLLMSPDYVQPLIPTELSALVKQVFSSNGVSWLRHSAARKYVQWRKTQGREDDLVDDNDDDDQPTPLSSSGLRASRPLSESSPFPNLPRRFQDHNRSRLLSPQPPEPQVLTPPVGATSSYALARLADHAQREERLAQVRLANWAADLQRSLARERAEYAALARADRAVWLAERIGECVREETGAGALVPLCSGNSGSGGGDSSNDFGFGRDRGRRGDWSRSRERQRQRQRGSGCGFPNPSPADLRATSRPEEGARSRQQQLGDRRSSHTPSHQTESQSQAKTLRNNQQQQRQQNRHQQRFHLPRGPHMPHSTQDPLGLLEVAGELRRRGLVALEVLGSLGVLGGLALWVTRHYLHLDWERFWYG